MTGPAVAAAVKLAKERALVDPSPVRWQISLLLLAAWLGAALLFVASVAPSAFAVLPKRMLAGALVGRVLPVVFVSGIVTAILSLTLSLRSGHPRRVGHRAALLVQITGCVVAFAVVGPAIESYREQLPADLESVPVDDARRVAFGKLHGVSVALLGLAMLGSGTALVLGLWPAKQE
jgi:hypothetical protein